MGWRSSMVAELHCWHSTDVICNKVSFTVSSFADVNFDNNSCSFINRFPDKCSNCKRFLSCTTIWPRQFALNHSSLMLFSHTFENVKNIFWLLLYPPFRPHKFILLTLLLIKSAFIAKSCGSHQPFSSSQHINYPWHHYCFGKNYVTFKWLQS